MVQFEVQRQTPGKFHDPVIENGDAGFEADSHARSVHFYKNVFRKIAQDIHVYYRMLEIPENGPAFRRTKQCFLVA